MRILFVVICLLVPASSFASYIPPDPETEAAAEQACLNQAILNLGTCQDSAALDLQACIDAIEDCDETDDQDDYYDDCYDGSLSEQDCSDIYDMNMEDCDAIKEYEDALCTGDYYLEEADPTVIPTPVPDPETDAPTPTPTPDNYSDDYEDYSDDYSEDDCSEYYDDYYQE